MKKLSASIFILLILISSTYSQKQEKMQWFQHARLGIFVHWGIYAVNGIDESWSFYNEYITYDDYMKQLEDFTASDFDPAEWVRLIKESGAGYAVITAKHHDGVALWNTELSDLNTVDRTPAERDLINPFVKEIRKKGLKVGIYYSLIDWSHPDYPAKTKTEMRYEHDSLRWANFSDFNLGQISEISQQFKPDLYWFDGDWEHTAEEWKAREIREMILDQNPAAIINSRLQGHGDYATPEQGVPVHKPGDKYWELCMTMNDSWGYQPNDQNYKTPNQIIRIFADVIGMGGNLLLDIGPKENGDIPPEQVEVLEELGRWTGKHRDAIYGTHAGIPKDYYYGPSTISADSSTLYLFVEGIPNGPIAVKGLLNDVNRIRVVGNGTKLSWDVRMKTYWSKKPGILYIDVPEETLDPQLTVIAVLLEGKLNLEK